LTAGKRRLECLGSQNAAARLALTFPPLSQHLQEALGLPAPRGDENPQGTPTGEGARVTENDAQGEEEGEEEPTRTPSSRPSPSPTPEDTVTYILGRLAGLDAGLHQVHVRLHALDTRVAELTRGLRQLREVAGDTRDALQTLQEAQSRAEREHGRLEGCLKGVRLGHKCFLLSRDFEAQAAAQARCTARGGKPGAARGPPADGSAHPLPSLGARPLQLAGVAGCARSARRGPLPLRERPACVLLCLAPCAQPRAPGRAQRRAAPTQPQSAQRRRAGELRGPGIGRRLLVGPRVRAALVLCLRVPLLAGPVPRLSTPSHHLLLPGWCTLQSRPSLLAHRWKGVPPGWPIPGWGGSCGARTPSLPVFPGSDEHRPRSGAIKALWNLA
uniref:Uncharacterized protein n=1 Tax=Sus scrofa TaxID=9823 RepID=A0A4X1VPY7_PIG